jgi:lysozyme
MWRNVHLIALLYIGLASCQQAPSESKEKQDDHVETKSKAQPAYGIDISNFQGDVLDFINRKQDSLSFVICKATEGKTLVDLKFKSNWEMLKEKKFIRGAYHFYRCEDNPDAQVAHYIMTVGELGLSDLPPIVDVEVVDQCSSHTEIQKHLLQFLGILQKRVGRIPIICTSTAFGNEYLKDPQFAKYPLWVADWTSKSKPSLPSVWESAGWKFWQKTDDYDIHSIQTDFDRFNGNVEALKQFIQETTLPN